MALLTTGNFYTATFLPTTDAAWAALAPNGPSGINGELYDAIFLAIPTPIDFYVIDATAGIIAFVGGQAYGFDDTLLDGAAAAGTTFVLDAVDGTTTAWGTNAAGALFLFDSVAGVLRSYTVGEATAFKTFIP